MTEINDHIIKDCVGIHARPAGRLVAITKQYDSKISLIYNNASYDSKSLLAILKLGIKSGEKISFSFDGADEKKAKEAVEDFLKTNL